MMITHLLIVDAQQDFCDGPCQGALAVPGAHEDMLRLAEFIQKNTDALDSIHASMDCHRLLDIAHPCWWQNADGDHPAPFTIITAEEIESGKWITSCPDAAERSLAYVNALEVAGNYPLCIWPPHCLLGSQGQSLHPAISNAVNAWEIQVQQNVDYIIKGLNPWTEHYSALKAEIPDPADNASQINNNLIEGLSKADAIIIAGEALSHCVRATVMDIANALGPDSINKFVFLTDASSSVPGFEHLGKEFLENLSARGMQLTTTERYSVRA